MTWKLLSTQNHHHVFSTPPFSPHTRWQRNASGTAPGLWAQMQEGATLTRASTVCTGHQLFRSPTLLVHVRAAQAEVTVVVGNDCPIRSFLGYRNSKKKKNLILGWREFLLAPFLPRCGRICSGKNIKLECKVSLQSSCYFGLSFLFDPLQLNSSNPLQAIQSLV